MKDNYDYEVNKSSIQCSETIILQFSEHLMANNQQEVRYILFICIMLILSMTLRNDNEGTFSTEMCLRVWEEQEL